jgi:hypothetical protein
MPGGGVQEWTGTEYVDLGLSNWYPTRLLEDSMGRLWAGTNDAMIGVYSGSAWQLFDGSLFAGGPVADPDLPGWVWLTGWDGAVLTDGLSVEKFPLPEYVQGAAPMGDGRAWVGGTGLYLVDMTSKTYEYFGPEIIRSANPRPFGISPDGILWYGCDDGLGWLDTKVPSRRRSGIFSAPPGGKPQWGGLPWWPLRGEIRVASGYYELWMTTPSRGITVLRVSPRP